MNLRSSDDGRDLRQRDPRAVARQAARRERRRLVRGAPGRGGAEGPVGRRRGDDARGRARAARDARRRARGDGRGSVASSPRGRTTSAGSPTSTPPRSRRPRAAPRVRRGPARGRAGPRPRSGSRRRAAEAREIARRLAEVELGVGQRLRRDSGVGLARRHRRRLAAFRAVLAAGSSAPFIMVDELIWSELARGIADDGERAIRGVPDRRLQHRLPPAASARPTRSFDGLPGVIRGREDDQAFVMSLAAVPAYFLARRVVTQWLALLGALLAVAVPRSRTRGP